MRSVQLMTIITNKLSLEISKKLSKKLVFCIREFKLYFSQNALKMLYPEVSKSFWKIYHQLEQNLLTVDVFLVMFQNLKQQKSLQCLKWEISNNLNKLQQQVLSNIKLREYCPKILSFNLLPSQRVFLRTSNSLSPSFWFLSELLTVFSPYLHFLFYFICFFFLLYMTVVILSRVFSTCFYDFSYQLQHLPLFNFHIF